MLFIGERAFQYLHVFIGLISILMFLVSRKETLLSIKKEKEKKECILYLIGNIILKIMKIISLD